MKQDVDPTCNPWHYYSKMDCSSPLSLLAPKTSFCPGRILRSQIVPRPSLIFWSLELHDSVAISDKMYHCPPPKKMFSRDHIINLCFISCKLWNCLKFLVSQFLFNWYGTDRTWDDLKLFILKNISNYLYNFNITRTSNEQHNISNHQQHECLLSFYDSFYSG